MSNHDLALTDTLAAAPATQRGSPARMDVSGDTLAYGSGNCVLVAPHAAPASAGGTLVCHLHRAAVTAVRFSPSGALIASGDRAGVLCIFANTAGTPERFSGAILQGAIRDIAWSADGEHLVVVGEGRTCFGVALTRGGEHLGSLKGHTRAIIACDMAGAGPLRAFTGSLDSFVGVYEGVPITFTRNAPGHTNAVNAVRYCAVVDEVATCSSSTDLLIFDGTTGEQKRQIASGHTGTIYSLAWSPDGRSLATASADRHVHILAAEDGRVRYRVCLGSGLADSQNGLVWTRSAGVVAVSLAGTRTTIAAETGAVTSAIAGHQSRILLLHVCPGSGHLLSLSVDGRLLRWSGDDSRASTAVVMPAGTDVASAAVVAGSTLYMVAGAQVLTYDTRDPAATVGVLSCDGGGFAPAVCATAHGLVVVVVRTRLRVLNDKGACVAEEALPPAFHASTAAAQGGVVMVGGDRAVRVYSIDASGAVCASGVVFSGHHTGAVSAIAMSADGARAASADGTSRTIYVWSPASGALLVRHPMCHHAAAVTNMAFHESGDHLLSGGLDCTLIVWDLSTGTRRMEDAAHRGGVTAVAWGPDGTLVSAGGDLCIRRWAT